MAFPSPFPSGNNMGNYVIHPIQASQNHQQQPPSWPFQPPQIPPMQMSQNMAIMSQPQSQLQRQPSQQHIIPLPPNVPPWLLQHHMQQLLQQQHNQQQQLQLQQAMSQNPSISVQPVALDQPGQNSRPQLAALVTSTHPINQQPSSTPQTLAEVLGVSHMMPSPSSVAMPATMNNFPFNGQMIHPNMFHQNQYLVTRSDQPQYVPTWMQPQPEQSQKISPVITETTNNEDDEVTQNDNTNDDNEAAQDEDEMDDGNDPGMSQSNRNKSWSKPTRLPRLVNTMTRPRGEDGSYYYESPRRRSEQNYQLVRSRQPPPPPPPAEMGGPSPQRRWFDESLIHPRLRDRGSWINVSDRGSRSPGMTTAERYRNYRVAPNLTNSSVFNSMEDMASMRKFDRFGYEPHGYREWLDVKSNARAMKLPGSLGPPRGDSADWKAKHNKLARMMEYSQSNQPDDQTKKRKHRHHKKKDKVSDDGTTVEVRLAFV